MATANELSKPMTSSFQDLQIDLLKQKLEFSQKQLQDRDTEINHYKNLVETLQSLVQSRPDSSNTRSRSNSRSSGSEEEEVSSDLMQESHDSGKGNNQTVVAIQKRKPGKIKKQVSFHEDVRVRYIGTEIQVPSSEVNTLAITQLDSLPHHSIEV